MNAQKFNDLLKRMKYDKNAVEEFYNAFYLTIKAHVKYRFGYLADPEDMAQDIFMKLYTMETPSYVKAPAKWLGKFSDNFVIDQLRASRPELELLESHPSDFDLEKTKLKKPVTFFLFSPSLKAESILRRNNHEKTFGNRFNGERRRGVPVRQCRGGQGRNLLRQRCNALGGDERKDLLREQDGR